MNTSLDSVFKLQSNLVWLPWIGKDFNTRKILIVGDSHFEDGDHWQEGNPNVTRQVINQCIFDTTSKQFRKSKILNSIERTVYNKKEVTKSESQTLWNSSAYFNLVQDLMSDKRTTPTVTQLDNGWRNFLDLVSIIKPSMIIKCGVRGFGRLGYIMHKERNEWNFSHKEFIAKPRVLNIENNSYRTKIVFTNHPSGRGGFKYAHWGTIINEQFPDLQRALSDTEQHSS